MEVMEWPRGTYIYSQMANDGWRDFEPGFLQCYCHVKTGNVETSPLFRVCWHGDGCERSECKAERE